MYITLKAKDSSSVNSAIDSSAFQFRLKPVMKSSDRIDRRSVSRAIIERSSKITLFTVYLALIACAHSSHIERSIENAWQTNSSIPLAHVVDETLTIERAYEIQTRIVRRALRDAKPAGFKAGLTSAPSRARFGATSPIAGVLLTPAHLTPSKLDLNVLKGLYIEVEVAMRLRTPIRTRLASIDELKSHIDGIAPAIELPNLDYQDAQKLNALDIVASNVAAAYFIVGSFAPVEERDPNAVSATLECDGKELNVGQGHDAMGDQWAAALWLVNTMLDQGWTLESGQILLTGALGKMIRAQPGRCSADFGDWGRLNVQVSQ